MMPPTESIHLEHLGQTGMRLDTNGLTILVDPYLSHSVQELDAPDLIRQVPIPYQPGELTKVDWVLITHEHLDHCDPHTLPILAEASPQAQFMGPSAVRKQLSDWGISKDRIQATSSVDFKLGNQFWVRSVPAAHPKLRFDQYNQPQVVGYLFRHNNKTLYLAGDTCVCDELIEALKQVGTIDLAFLPVNEDNYFRRRRGIIGNMSIRDAFGLASEVGVKAVVPVHFDMFAANSTTVEEIKAVYYSKKWPFALHDCEDIKL